MSPSRKRIGCLYPTYADRFWRDRVSGACSKDGAIRSAQVQRAKLLTPYTSRPCFPLPLKRTTPHTVIPARPLGSPLAGFCTVAGPVACSTDGAIRSAQVQRAKLLTPYTSRPRFPLPPKRTAPPTPSSRRRPGPTTTLKVREHAARPLRPRYISLHPRSL